MCISLTPTLVIYCCLLTRTRRPSNELYNFIIEVTYFYPLLEFIFHIRIEVNWLLILRFNVIDAYPIVACAISNG